LADHEDLIHEEVRRLRERDDVRAVAVVGSYARDPDQDHTDIDLFIIVDGDWRRRETEVIDGTVIERFYNSMGWSRRYLEGKKWYTNYRWYTGADIRHDPEDLFTELEAYAMEQKDDRMDLDDEDLQAIRYFIWDMQEDIDGADGAQRTYLQQKLFEYLLEKQYLLEGEVPVKENYRIEKLEDIDPEMHEMAIDFLESDPGDRAELLEEMVDHVTASIGEPDPEYQTAREALDD
jgi:predicted nucleotidyltransferase